MKKLIIIATYNEKENITPMIKAVFESVPKIDLLIIDDNSPDQTQLIVQDLINNIYTQQLFLLVRPAKMGLGSAYIAGFNYAIAHNYDIILHMDADFSHNPKYLPQFLEQIKSNDLVIGSRYTDHGGVKNWGLLRKIISRGGSFYARTILGIKIRDLTGGFKCFRRKVLQHLLSKQLQSGGYSFQIETTYKSLKAGFKVKEIPIVFEDRRVGQSKMSARIFIEALVMVLKMRFRN